MRRLPFGFCLVAAAALATLPIAGVSAAERVVDVESRPGQPVRILLDVPSRPVGAVVLVAGGHGNLAITPTGQIGWGAGNQVVRSRPMYLRGNIATAVTDLAPDMRIGNGVVNGYRWSDAHVRDLGAVVAYMRQFAQPVVLVGTSRGALSVASAAARLSGPARPDGVVITAGMLMDETPSQPSVQRQVPGIRGATMPFLLIHHTADACAYTPASGPERFRPLLTAARSVDVQMLSGGGPVRGDPCDAAHYHGFVGIDEQVVSGITTWIARLPR